MQPLFTTGLGGESIDWELISQSTTDNGLVESVYEAYSAKYDRTYHLVDLSGGLIDVSQHLTVR